MMHHNRYTKSNRSIWMRAQATTRVLTLGNGPEISVVIYREIDEVADELRREIEDVRNEIPEDTAALANDVESLEKRVSDLEYRLD